MRNFYGAVILAMSLSAQPPLTLIQDTLYQADGTKFQGLAVISWNSFQSSDLSDIAANAVRVPIVNGSLRVRLVPTTNAVVPGSYFVVYSSNKVQFTETWAVPPSLTQLKVKDVRVATSSWSGTAVAPANSTSIQISDVAGLQSELQLRPSEGAGFATSRTAVINSTGAIDGAAGNPGDCVHVDGTTGACGTGPSSVSFVDLEIPGGAVDGANGTFTLSRVPSPPSSLMVFRNGLLMQAGPDFTLGTQVITFIGAQIPQPGDTLQCSYRLTP